MEMAKGKAATGRPGGDAWPGLEDKSSKNGRGYSRLGQTGIVGRGSPEV